MCLILALILIFSRSLQRGPDGRFNDSELAAIIKNAYVVLPDDNRGQSADNAAESNIQPEALGLVVLPIS